jgi:hypothetical protein
VRDFAKEDGTVHTEKGSLQGFGEEVSEHDASGAVLDRDGLLFDVVSDKEITNVDVA